jgi:hypothetical protein
MVDPEAPADAPQERIHFTLSPSGVKLFKREMTREVEPLRVEIDGKTIRRASSEVSF